MKEKEMIEKIKKELEEKKEVYGRLATNALDMTDHVLLYGKVILAKELLDFIEILELAE